MDAKWEEALVNLFEALSFYEAGQLVDESLEEIKYQFKENGEKIRLFYNYKATEEQKRLIERAKEIINFREW